MGRIVVAERVFSVSFQDLANYSEERTTIIQP
jgi:hypothetical protein